MSGHPRFVEVEWDRGHDSVVGIVVAEGADGILLNPVRNLHPEPGFQWIARHEILSLEDLHEDAVAVRLAVIRNTATPATDADVRSLTDLLQWARTTRTLVMVHQARTGSAEGLVGTIDAIENDHLDLQLVDLDGTWENEIQTIAVDQVISLQWGDDYLDALSDLLADHPAPAGRTPTQDSDAVRGGL